MKDARVKPVATTARSHAQRPHQHTNLLFFGGGRNYAKQHHNRNTVHIQPTPKPKPVPSAKDTFVKNGTKSDSKSPDPFTKKVIKQVKESNQITCFSRLLTAWADEESVLRLSWITVVSILVSFIAAGIFYAIEHKTECKWNYVQSLWFVNTISTTIGYGSLAPCSSAGKAMSVVFACIGIPLNVVALSNIGVLMSRLLHFLWVKLKANCLKCMKKCGRRKKKTNVELVPTAEQAHVAEDNGAVPLSLAIIVTCFWFLLSALFFCLSEPGNMSFGNAFYFVMISVTTIGFGDITPINYNLVVIQFFFVIIGIALFSMLINIIQEKVDGMNDFVEALISKEYAKAQQEGMKLEANDEKAAREHVRNMIKKQKGGGLLHLVMGKNMENRLVEDYLEKARKVIATTQTDNFVHDQEIMAVPSMKDVMTQIVIVPGALNKDQATQIRWVPKLYAPVDWLDLRYVSRNSVKGKELTRTNSKL